VHIFSQVSSDYEAGAAALSVVLLTVSLFVLISLSLIQRWSSKHDR
jgi:ABC-type sulfate transport system permease component